MREKRTGTARRLVWTVALCSSLSGAPAGAQFSDHLQCFSVKDKTNPVVSSFLATLAAQQGPQLPFPPTTDCRIKSRADLFCLHVQKTMVDPPPTGGGSGLAADAPSFACYRVKGKCSASPTGSLLNEKDQFRSGLLTIGSTRYVCAPATIGECGQTANQCNGSCPAGQVCSSLFFGGCTCVVDPGPACNVALGTSMCPGSTACPPDRVCVNAFGGCSCVRSCAGSFPACDQEQGCGIDEHCGNVGGACACVSNVPDCGDRSQPMCGGGNCPAGTTCQNDGATACKCM